jgi:hypothetical protein
VCCITRDRYGNQWAWSGFSLGGNTSPEASDFRANKAGAVVVHPSLCRALVETF